MMTSALAYFVKEQFRLCKIKEELTEETRAELKSKWKNLSSQEKEMT